MGLTIRTRIGLPILSLLFLFSALAGARQKTMPPPTPAQHCRPLPLRQAFTSKGLGDN